MWDDEADLIELLGGSFPEWREISDDPFAAAELLGLRLRRRSFHDELMLDPLGTEDYDL